MTYNFNLRKIGQTLRSLSRTIGISDRQTHIQTYTQVTLYLSSAMHCIGQTTRCKCRLRRAVAGRISSVVLLVLLPVTCVSLGWQISVGLTAATLPPPSLIRSYAFAERCFVISLPSPFRRRRRRRHLRHFVTRGYFNTQERYFCRHRSSFSYHTFDSISSINDRCDFHAHACDFALTVAKSVPSWSTAFIYCLDN